jgi:hypothetical protein
MIYSGLYDIDGCGTINVQVDNNNKVHITALEPYVCPSYQSDGFYYSPFHVDIRVDMVDGKLQFPPENEMMTDLESDIITKLNKF